MSQRLLGGVGALRANQVRAVKQRLVLAMAKAAQQRPDVSEHLRATTLPGPPQPGALTEALSSALLAHLTGQRPGSVDGTRLRRLVVETWARLEAPGIAVDAGLWDGLASLIADLVGNSDSGFLRTLRAESWTDETIVEELRAMVLAGWGSTTAAALSAIALGVTAPLPPFAINEVLRLYPPSFMIARVIGQQHPQLPFALGDVVLVSPWLIHRNEVGWSTPNSYEPVRWHHARPPHWFVPFGLGSRRCPAAAMARAQIAAVVEHFSATTAATEPPIATTLHLVESRSPSLVPSW